LFLCEANSQQGENRDQTQKTFSKHGNRLHQITPPISTQSHTHATCDRGLESKQLDWKVTLLRSSKSLPVNQADGTIRGLQVRIGRDGYGFDPPAGYWSHLGLPVSRWLNPAET
jgi:hypothetical protein